MSQKKIIKVSHADVYAARTRVALDKQDKRKTPEWVVKLSQVELRPTKNGNQ